MIEGACDKLLPPGWTKEIADQLPDGRSTVIEAVGQCPQLERSAIVNAVLLDFLVSVAG